MIGMRHIQKRQTGGQRQYYKYIQLSVYIMVLLFLLSGCFMTEEMIQKVFPDGRGDWKYPLPNEYYIFMANSHEISLTKSVQQSSASEKKVYSILLPSYIYAFRYSSQYVGIIQTPSKDASVDSPDVKYYLVDTREDTILGPFQENEYQKKCGELRIVFFSDWIYSKDLNCYNVPESVPYFDEVESDG